MLPVHVRPSSPNSNPELQKQAAAPVSFVHPAVAEQSKVKSEHASETNKTSVTLLEPS